MSDLLARIAARLGGRLLRHEPLTGGVSASVTALHLDLPEGARTVVARQHDGHDHKGQSDGVLAMEYALMEALHARGWPVPEPLLLDTAGVPCMAMAFVEGTAEVAPTDAVLGKMASFLRDLHALPLGGLPDLPRRTDPTPELPDYLPPGYADLPGILAARGPLTPPRLSLLHGDFWPGNILWQDGEIAAVIDWEDAAIGDPLCDLAGARVELLWWSGEEAMEAFTAHYLAGRPVEVARLALWELFVAAAGLTFLHHWGLPADVEADMRRKGERVMARAAGVVRA